MPHVTAMEREGVGSEAAKVIKKMPDGERPIEYSPKRAYSLGSEFEDESVLQGTTQSCRPSAPAEVQTDKHNTFW